MLQLRSDNMGALSLYSSLKGASGGMNAIAREYALDASEGAYEPDLISHIPGVANKVSDILSRRLDPKYAHTWKVPAFLEHAEQVFPPPRPLTWWRARRVPVQT